MRGRLAGNDWQQDEGVENKVKINILFYYSSCNPRFFLAGVEIAKIHTSNSAGVAGVTPENTVTFNIGIIVHDALFRTRCSFMSSTVHYRNSSQSLGYFIITLLPFTPNGMMVLGVSFSWKRVSGQGCPL
jgi:hypothetical protein